MSIDADIKNYKIQAFLLEEGIIENVVKENALVEKDDLLAIKQENIRLAAGKKYTVLVTSKPYSSITKEARELSASKEFVLNTMAKALIVESLPHKIVGNFYLKVNKPHIKTQIFTDRDKAILWLRKQLKKSNSFN